MGDTRRLGLILIVIRAAPLRTGDPDGNGRSGVVAVFSTGFVILQAYVGLLAGHKHTRRAHTAQRKN